MKSRLALIVLLVGVSCVTACGSTSTSTVATATQQAQVNATPLAPVGHFAQFESNAKSGDWNSSVTTQGPSDFYVVEVTIPPGGTLGWHSHQGPSWVIVKSGTATFYQASDSTCTPHVIPTGSTLFEPAGLVHTVRNEGSVPLVNVVVQLLPAGAPRLIKQPDPGHCPFKS